jgi:ketosteroid isomerase-like protein
MISHANPRIQKVIDFFEACNEADVTKIKTLLTDDVREYMLEPKDKPLFGPDHVASYWAKVVKLFKTHWVVEHGIATDDEAVVEWSMEWTSPEDGNRYIVHGAEWYVFRGDKISEIRGYYHHGERRNTGLTDFPYAERGYRVR